MHLPEPPGPSRFLQIGWRTFLSPTNPIVTPCTRMLSRLYINGSPDSPVYDACLRTSSDGRRISRQASGVCRAFAISPLAVFIGAGAEAEVSQELVHLQGRSGAGVDPTERGAATPHRF